jgi:hypothetical protein
MDNTSFLGLGEDGSMNIFSRITPGDSKFHIKGALVVAPDKALAHSLEQLKMIKSACGSNPVFILTPWRWPRFAKVPCCNESGQMSNLADPATVIDSMELVCGNSFSHEKADLVITAGWALDPVHPTKHIYAKAALNLIEKLAVSNKPAAAAVTTNRKRTWSASATGAGRRVAIAPMESEEADQIGPRLVPGKATDPPAGAGNGLTSRGTTAAAAETAVAAEKGTGTTRMIRGRAAVPEGHPIVVPTADPDPDTGEGAVGSGEAATPIKWSLGDRVIPNFFSVK